MASPRGNKFWERRSKHGRDAIFADAALLWTAAAEYFTYCDSNPLKSVEFLGKDATRRLVPKMRAYTMAGLYLYIGVNHSFFSDMKIGLDKALKGKDKKKIEHAGAMLDVIHRIEQTVYVQKFEGAAAGLLNPSLIGKDLGLVEKQQVDNKTDGKQVITVRYANRDHAAAPAPGAAGGTE